VISQNSFEGRHPSTANRDVLHLQTHLVRRDIETCTREDQITLRNWRRGVCAFYSVVVCLLGVIAVATIDRHPRSNDVAVDDLTSSIAIANGHTSAFNVRQP
jgi:hypothetical protein